MIGPGWKCVYDTELDQSFSELVGSPPGNENSKSYGQERSKLGQAGRALPASILGLLGVPIGTVDRVFPYITPTWGPPTFCMDWAGKGHCPKYAAKLRSFSANVFRQHHKAHRAL